MATTTARPRKTAATKTTKTTTKKTAAKKTATSTGPARLPKGCKLTKALSKDQTRPLLTGAYIREDRKRGWELLGTNSFLAVRIPVEVDGGDAPQCGEGHIPESVVKLMEKGEAITQPEGKTTFDAAGHACPTLQMRDGSLVPRVDTGQYPNLDMLWPDKPAKTFEVALNAEFLHQLAQAMGASSVKLTFNADHPLKPIEVTPIYATGKSGRMPSAPDARGLLMPVRIPE